MPKKSKKSVKKLSKKMAKQNSALGRGLSILLGVGLVGVLLWYVYDTYLAQPVEINFVGFGDGQEYTYGRWDFNQAVDYSSKGWLPSTGKRTGRLSDGKLVMDNPAAGMYLFNRTVDYKWDGAIAEYIVRVKMNATLRDGDIQTIAGASGDVKVVEESGIPAIAYPLKVRVADSKNRTLKEDSTLVVTGLDGEYEVVFQGPVGRVRRIYIYPVPSAGNALQNVIVDEITVLSRMRDLGRRVDDETEPSATPKPGTIEIEGKIVKTNLEGTGGYMLIGDGVRYALVDGRKSGGVPRAPKPGEREGYARASFDQYLGKTVVVKGTEVGAEKRSGDLQAFVYSNLLLVSDVRVK